MATVDSTNLVTTPEDYSVEVARARKLAERYHVEFVDMDEFRIDQELFRSIPADLMLRYGFVPARRDGKSLVIVVSDPTDLPMIDELGIVLGTPLKVVKEDETGEESLTVDRLTSDTSPVIRLVDSTVFTAIQRRASDIHIET